MPDEAVDQAEDARHVRPFTDWLREQRNGLCQSELTDHLSDLVEAVSIHGKPGTLTLKITVRPAGKTGLGTVLVSDETSVKKPQAERSEAIWFVDRDFGLTRSDPSQLRLDLREAPRPPAPKELPDV